MLDVISLNAHGVDTVRASFRVLDSIPETDPGWQSDMLGAGFEHSSRTFLEDGEVVN